MGIKKAANAARADDLALAAFVSRPQAEAQIGAKQEKSYITNLAVSTRKARPPNPEKVLLIRPVARAEYHSPSGSFQASLCSSRAAYFAADELASARSGEERRGPLLVFKSGERSGAAWFFGDLYNNDAVIG